MTDFPFSGRQDMIRTAQEAPPDHAVSWIFLRSFTGKERDEETGYGYFVARYAFDSDVANLLETNTNLA